MLKLMPSPPMLYQIKLKHLLIYLSRDVLKSSVYRSTLYDIYLYMMFYVVQDVFFSLGLPLNFLSSEKLVLARSGVSWTIYVNVDSANLGFPYDDFLGETQ